MPRTRGTFRDSIPRAQLRARSCTPSCGASSSGSGSGSAPASRPSPSLEVGSSGVASSLFPRQMADGEPLMTRHIGSSRVLASIVVAAFVPPLHAQAGAAAVPLCPGLTIVSAISHPEGDYESIKTIASADERGVLVNYSAQVPTRHGSLRNWRMRRMVLHKYLGTATLYAHYFHSHGSLTIPGSTALGISTAVLRSLKRTGAAELGLIAEENHGYPADRSEGAEPVRLRGGLEAPAGRHGTVPVQVTVNDAAATLPTIHARGSHIGDKVDFYFLDDEQNPLALQYAVRERQQRDGRGPRREDLPPLHAARAARRARSASSGSSARCASSVAPRSTTSTSTSTASRSARSRIRRCARSPRAARQPTGGSRSKGTPTASRATRTTGPPPAARRP